MPFLQSAWSWLRCPGFGGLCSKAHVTVPGNTLGRMRRSHHCSVAGFGTLRKSGSVQWAGPSVPQDAAVQTLYCVMCSSKIVIALDHSAWGAAAPVFALSPVLVLGVFFCTWWLCFMSLFKVWCDWLHCFEIQSVIAVQTSDYSLNKPCLGSNGASPVLWLMSACLAGRDL